VSTAAAYQSLNRGELTIVALQNNIDSFQAYAWGASGARGVNDFEEAIFCRHPPLRALKQKLLKLGANPAMMSGSGSSIFGIFDQRTQVTRATKFFRKETVFAISLVSQARYRALWRRWLAAHRIQSEWPPQSRYER
jgi:4-diphosphocytidyl-2-C-methyl-D-erythritol kinase